MDGIDLENQLMAAASKQHILLIARWVEDDLLRFDLLYRLMLTGEPACKARAARVLGVLVERYPDIVGGKESEIVSLALSAQHEGYVRELLRMLCFVELPDECQGELLDFCFQVMPQPSKPLAWRVYAMEIAFRICSPSVELLGELGVILDDIRQEDCPPSIESRTRTILTKINRRIAATDRVRV